MNHALPLIDKMCRDPAVTPPGGSDGGGDVSEEDAASGRGANLRPLESFSLDYVS